MAHHEGATAGSGSSLDRLTVVTVAADALAQELEGEAVLLSMANERYFGLDEIGTRVWQLIEHSPTVETLMATMLAEYDVDEAELEGDVSDLLTALHRSQLIELHVPGQACH